MTSSVRNVGTSAASSNPFTTSFLGPEHALHNKGKATNATTHKREIQINHLSVFSFFAIPDKLCHKIINSYTALQIIPRNYPLGKANP